jgi:hypothetical protein
VQSGIRPDTGDQKRPDYPAGDPVHPYPQVSRYSSQTPTSSQLYQPDTHKYPGIPGRHPQVPRYTSQRPTSTQVMKTQWIGRAQSKEDLMSILRHSRKVRGRGDCRFFIAGTGIMIVRFCSTWYRYSAHKYSTHSSHIFLYITVLL